MLDQYGHLALMKTHLFFIYTILNSLFYDTDPWKKTHFFGFDDTSFFVVFRC